MATHKRRTVRMSYEDAAVIHAELLARPAIPGVGFAPEFQERTGWESFAFLAERRRRRRAAFTEGEVI